MTMVDDSNEDDLKVKAPEQWATGVPAVTHAIQYSLEQTSIRRTAINLFPINQANGVDCPGCAWPEPAPGERKMQEHWENGAKHINDEATTRRLMREFFEKYPVSVLVGKSDLWLNQQGRATEPMVKRPGSDHYQPIGWDEAFDLLSDELHRLDSPDEALFYTSGRLSNEAAFLPQLLGLADRQLVDLVSTWEDGVTRRANAFRIVAYPAARGSAASYYPEINVLVPQDSVAEINNTPMSKGVYVRLEPCAGPVRS